MSYLTTKSYPGQNAKETPMAELKESYRWAPEAVVAHLNRMSPSSAPSLDVASSFKYYESSDVYGIDQESAVMVLEGERRSTMYPEAAYLRIFFTRADPEFFVQLLNPSGGYLIVAEVSIRCPERMPAIFDTVLQGFFDPSPEGRLRVEQYDARKQKKAELEQAAREKQQKHGRAAMRIQREIIQPRMNELWKEIRAAIVDGGDTFDDYEIRAEIQNTVTYMSSAGM